MTSSLSNLVTMLEKLPDAMQDNVLNHVKAYLEELEREQRWENTFLKLQETVTAKFP
jgi:muconolactone delta-isomerase